MLYAIKPEKKIILAICGLLLVLLVQVIAPVGARYENAPVGGAVFGAFAAEPESDLLFSPKGNVLLGDFVPNGNTLEIPIRFSYSGEDTLQGQIYCNTVTDAEGTEASEKYVSASLFDAEGDPVEGELGLYAPSRTVYLQISFSGQQPQLPVQAMITVTFYGGNKELSSTFMLRVCPEEAHSGNADPEEAEDPVEEPDPTEEPEARTDEESLGTEEESGQEQGPPLPSEIDAGIFVQQESKAITAKLVYLKMRPTETISGSIVLPARTRYYVAGEKPEDSRTANVLYYGGALPVKLQSDVTTEMLLDFSDLSDPIPEGLELHGEGKVDYVQIVYPEEQQASLLTAETELGELPLITKSHAVTFALTEIPQLQDHNWNEVSLTVGGELSFGVQKRNRQGGWEELDLSPTNLFMQLNAGEGDGEQGSIQLSMIQPLEGTQQLTVEQVLAGSYRLHIELCYSGFFVASLEVPFFVEYSV